MRLENGNELPSWSWCSNQESVALVAVMYIGSCLKVEGQSCGH